jgi:hypothetical protein
MERASRAGEKEEEEEARAEAGGGGFPGEEASAVVDCRCRHLIDSVAGDLREGSTSGRRSTEAAFSRRGTAPRRCVHGRWLQPRNNGPAGRAPRGQIMW